MFHTQFSKSMFHTQFSRSMFTDDDSYSFIFRVENDNGSLVPYTIETDLEAGRYPYEQDRSDGVTVFGENEPVVESLGLLSNGAYEQLVLYSEDVSNAVWDKTNVVVTGTNIVDISSGSSAYIFQAKTVTGVSTTFSFDIKSFDGSSGSWTMNYFYGGIHNRVARDITGEWTTISYTFTPSAGINYFYIGDNRGTGTVKKAYIKNINLTETPVVMPYIATTNTTITAPDNNSDATGGNQSPIGGIIAPGPDLLEILDEVLGSEIIGQEDEDWISLSYATIDSGVITFSLSASIGAASQDSTSEFEIGETYETTYRVVENDDNILFALSSLGFTGTTFVSSAVGTYTRRDVCTIDGGKFRFATASDTGTLIIDQVSCKKVAFAQGMITGEFTPKFSYTDTSGSGNIISWNNNLVSMWHKTDGSIRVSADIAQTSFMFVDIDYTAGTIYNFKICHGTHPTEGANKMQLQVTDGTTTWTSDVEDFVGTFSPEDYLKIGYENDLPFFLNNLKFVRSPEWPS